jgi:hypothetical protein
MSVAKLIIATCFGARIFADTDRRVPPPPPDESLVLFVVPAQITAGESVKLTMVITSPRNIDNIKEIGIFAIDQNRINEKDEIFVAQNQSDDGLSLSGTKSELEAKKTGSVLRSDSITSVLRYLKPYLTKWSKKGDGRAYEAIVKTNPDFAGTIILKPAALMVNTPLRFSGEAVSLTILPNANFKNNTSLKGIAFDRSKLITSYGNFRSGPITVLGDYRGPFVGYDLRYPLPAKEVKFKTSNPQVATISDDGVLTINSVRDTTKVAITIEATVGQFSTKVNGGVPIPID